MSTGSSPNRVMGFPRVATAFAQSPGSATVSLGLPDSGRRHVIRSIIFGYNGTPTEGLLTVVAGASSFSHAVGSAVTGQLDFPDGLAGDIDDTVAVDLSDPGGSLRASVTVLYW